MDTVQIDEVVEQCGGDPSALVGILQEIQRQEGYLPRKTLVGLSGKLDLPLSRLYALATFYRSFSLTPTGRHKVAVCLGTACHVRGAPRVLEELKWKLGIQPGQTTTDMAFTLETVNCLGACALGPVVVVDGKYYRQMKPAKVDAVLEKYRNAPEESET